MVSPRSRELLLRWLLALGCFALLIFFFSPPWAAFELWSRVPEMGAMLEVRRGVSVLQQVADPGTPIQDPLHRAIQWRLLFPLIGHWFGLPPWVLFGLAHVGCVAVLGYLVALLRRRGVTWASTLLAAIVTGSASWFFTSTGWLGYFDAWTALALLIVAFAPSRWPVWTACLWAPWVDERFVLALPLALACRWAASTADPELTVNTARRQIGSPASFQWKLDVLVPLAAAALFAFIRLGVLETRSNAGATLSGYFAGQDFLNAPPGRIVLGVWEGLRAGWIFLAAGLVALWRTASLPVARLQVVVVSIGSLVTAAVGLATAQDYSRSMTMLLPVVVLGLWYLLPSIATVDASPPHPGQAGVPDRAGLAGRATPSVLLRAAALLALLLPAHHVMNDRVNPIYYLYHELAAFSSPPAGAMPELFELRAIHEMERGEFAQAHASLTLAIKLARNPASAAKQRGILAASQGRWDAALSDFSLMAEHDPENPDAWLMRAQAHLALGRTREARADFDEALSLAPDSWSKRPDVARFLQKLNQAP